MKWKLELKKLSKYKHTKLFFLSFRVVKGRLEISITCDETCEFCSGHKGIKRGLSLTSWDNEVDFKNKIISYQSDFGMGKFSPMLIV